MPIKINILSGMFRKVNLMASVAANFCFMICTRDVARSRRTSRNSGAARAIDDAQQMVKPELSDNELCSAFISRFEGVCRNNGRKHINPDMRQKHIWKKFDPKAAKDGEKLTRCNMILAPRHYRLLGT